MTKFKLLIVTAALAVSQFAHAEFVDGNLLLSRMLGNETDQVYALAYTVGVADTTMNNLWCPTDQMKSTEVVTLTKAMLIASPTKRDLSADVFVVAALRNKYPCAAKKIAPGSKAV